jgi:hypothetical protein
LPGFAMEVRGAEHKEVLSMDDAQILLIDVDGAALFCRVVEELRSCGVVPERIVGRLALHVLQEDRLAIAE